MKLVVRGLPFEANAEDVVAFLNIKADQLNLPTWSDSGRCKGVGFVTCESLQEKERIMQNIDGKEFEADGNCRTLSIKEYEDRPRRGRGKGRQNRGGNRGDRGQRDSPAARGGPVRGGDQSFTADDQTSREVYVSNASFDATEDDFRAHFGQYGEVEEVTIPTQYATGRPKGFAFVRFATTNGVQTALAEGHNSEMLNRMIGVRANKGRVDRQPRQPQPRQSGLSQKPPGCTTIYVGNLPWSTDENKLESLFAECGTITSARIVKQSWTKRSRGFGYVEFEAEASVDTAVQKQLTVEGRELRLDYAENLNSST